MSDDLLIKISADTKDVSKAYEEIKSQTEGLDSSLGNIAKISGVLFAALTAQVGLSVKAFAEAENASLGLSNALQNQGIYTDELKESYKNYAEAVSAQTGISKDQIIQAQTVAQQYLGQIPVTDKLTKAIVDLSVAQGVSLTQASEEVSKAIGNGTGQLLRQGLQISATSTEAERYAQVLDFVNAKYAGASTALAPVTLATKKLGVAFEENAEALGARFAPAITTAIDALTNFLTPAKDASGIMVDLKASLIAVGLALTGSVTAVVVLGQALTVLRTSLIAINAELTVTRALLGIGILLAVVAAVTEVTLHFNQFRAVLQVMIKDIQQVGEALGALGKIFLGLTVAHSLDLVRQGVEDLKNSFKTLKNDVSTAWTEAGSSSQKGATEQIKIKKDLSDKEQAIKNQQDALRRQLDKAEQSYVLGQLEGQSEAILALKKQEIETLKALLEKQSVEERAILRKRLAQEREDIKAQMDEDAQIQAEFNKEDTAARKQHGNDQVRIQTAADKKEIADIKKNTDTKEKAQKKVYQEDLKNQQKAHNQFLQEQIKYGTAYATINQAIQSEEVQGTKKATGELVQLTQSKNATLKEIGKIATIAQIVIKTAESAMNIYAGFSAIPFVGQALGIAGAAAAVAFGAEQVRNVSAAESGAVVQGVGFGDKVPFLLEPGELIAPRQNFDEVVTSVAQSRGLVSNENTEDQSVSVNIGFNGPEASRVLTALRTEDKALGTYRSSR